MEILLGILIAIGGIALLIIFRSFTTLFHELGHAFPALWFTKETVEVFVGSYGDLNRSLQFHIGRLKLALRWNPFDWKLGVCRHKSSVFFWQELLIILGGPLASTAIATLGLWACLHYQLDQSWLVLIALFAGSALIDLVVNLTPSKQVINMYDGGVAYSDGTQLLNLLQEWRMPTAYFTARSAFANAQYEDSLTTTETLISDGNHHPLLYQLAIQSLEKLKRFDEVIGAHEHYQRHHPLSPKDYVTIANAYRKLNNFNEALRYYDFYLYDNYTDAATLYKRAEVYVELARFEKALDDLNRAIFLQKDSAQMYALRSLCHLKTNNLASAWGDILQAETLDNQQRLAEIPYYKGLYFEKENRPEEALTAYRLAKEKGIDFHGIDYKIVTIENSLKDFSN
ncbi:MAG: tetratricopeptide repeat protein [Bacteroidota bacterium]